MEWRCAWLCSICWPAARTTMRMKRGTNRQLVLHQMKVLIANGYVIDPVQGINTGRNLLFEDDRIVGVLERGEQTPEGLEVLDATGLIVAPGFIDMHTHLREPGAEYKETIASG